MRIIHISLNNHRRKYNNNNNIIQRTVYPVPAHCCQASVAGDVSYNQMFNVYIIPVFFFFTFSPGPT